MERNRLLALQGLLCRLYVRAQLCRIVTPFRLVRFLGVWGLRALMRNFLAVNPKPYFEGSKMLCLSIRSHKHALLNLKASSPSDVAILSLNPQYNVVVSILFPIFPI